MNLESINLLLKKLCDENGLVNMQQLLENLKDGKSLKLNNLFNIVISGKNLIIELNNLEYSNIILNIKDSEISNGYVKEILKGKVEDILSIFCYLIEYHDFENVIFISELTDKYKEIFESFLFKLKRYSDEELDMIFKGKTSEEKEKRRCDAQ